MGCKINMLVRNFSLVLFFTVDKLIIFYSFMADSSTKCPLLGKGLSEWYWD